MFHGAANLPLENYGSNCSLVALKERLPRFRGSVGASNLHAPSVPSSWIKLASADTDANRHKRMRARRHTLEQTQRQLRADALAETHACGHTDTRARTDKPQETMRVAHAIWKEGGHDVYRATRREGGSVAMRRKGGSRIRFRERPLT